MERLPDIQNKYKETSFEPLFVKKQIPAIPSTNISNKGKNTTLTITDLEEENKLPILVGVDGKVYKKNKTRRLRDLADYDSGLKQSRFSRLASIANKSSTTNKGGKRIKYKFRSRKQKKRSRTRAK